MNPAFEFISLCTNCGAEGAELIKIVMSKKKPNAVLGIQCSQCKQTLKFEGMIDPDAKTFPKRLSKRQSSILTVDGEPLDNVDDLPDDLIPKVVNRIVFPDGE